MDVFNPSSPLKTQKQVEWDVVTPSLADSLVSQNDQSSITNKGGELTIPDFVMVDPKAIERTDANDGISPKDLLKIRPPMKSRSRKVIPEKQRDAKYHTMRLKNTTASRRSREKKRQIDEGRVNLIKELTDKVAKLEAENVELKGEKAKRIELEEKCKLLQNVLSVVGFNENNMVKDIKPEKM